MKEIVVSTVENAELLIADPLRNIRGVGVKPGLEHSIFKEQDIRDMLDRFEVVLKAGGHGYIFCFTLQFEEWY